ncbi:CAP domain-containing protein [Cecembia rubra]|nr:CAP domain-containing protein [Cecembia rubra]
MAGIICTMSACVEIPETLEKVEPEIGLLTLEFDHQKLLTHLNEVRTKGCVCGDREMPPVSPLNWNNLLAKAAQKHSNDMYQNNFFNHIGSDNSTLEIRVNQSGYKWRSLGENIARGNMDEIRAVQSWKDSPSHCQLMMDADFLEVGVGKKGVFWTMVLAK